MRRQHHDAVRAQDTILKKYSSTLATIFTGAHATGCAFTCHPRLHAETLHHTLSWHRTSTGVLAFVLLR